MRPRANDRGESGVVAEVLLFTAAIVGAGAITLLYAGTDGQELLTAVGLADDGAGSGIRHDALNAVLYSKVLGGWIGRPWPSTDMVWTRG